MLLTHGLSPVWAAVAAAPTPIAAVRIALKRAQPADLAAPPDRSPLPKRSRRNLTAAMRVLEIGDFVIPDAPPAEPPVSSFVLPEDASCVRCSTGPQLSNQVVEVAKVAENANTEEGLEKKHAETPALRAHSSTLRRWAQEAAHTEVPEESLRALSRHHTPSVAASLLFPASIGPVAASAMLRAASLSSSSFVSAVASGPALALLRGLRAAASRDLIAALEGLADAHPRASLALFAGVDAGPPAAEALARVAGRLDATNAAAALAEVATARWGEHGVRVVEALVARCRREDGVAENVARGLERNVAGLEKSLRFGKFLLAAVRDVPGIKERYASVIRNVAGQSTVFLAKRAVALLPKETAAL